MAKQSKRSLGIVLVAVVALAAVAFAFWWNSDDQKDSRVWGRFRQQLSASGVTSVEVGGRNVPLSDADRADLARILGEAQFLRSNRAKEGPTPQATMTLTLPDGTRQALGLWSGAVFEMQPLRLDPESQFLVKSEALAAWLMNKLRQPVG